MLKSLLRDRLLLSLAGLAILLKLLSLRSDWVERYYTYGLYPFLSSLFRFLLGWIPFSVGDILYLAAGLYLLIKVGKFIGLLLTKRLRPYFSGERAGAILAKYLRLLLWIYLIFNLSWGLNYDRQGIAPQLGLHLQPYTASDLYELGTVLEQRLNSYAPQIDSLARLRYNNNDSLFRQGVADYASYIDTLSFLQYSFPSVKPSLYGSAGRYFNYTGYYNPFTAEAQIKTSIPVFIKPFVLNHEIAHQLGYAREDEASFVSFLVGRRSNSVDTRYSVYYEVFFTAYSQLARRDTSLAANLRSAIPLRARYDLNEYIRYLQRERNRVAPLMSVAYDRYLKMNRQPKGNATYDEVTAMLVAFLRKYGKDAL